MKRRLLAAFLSVVFLAATPVSAAELTTPGGTASTDVTFTVGDTNPKVFSVTVPAEIPMNMDLSGNLTVASNLNISNASSEAVKVTAINVAGKNGWSIEDWATDLSTEPDNTAKLALQFRGDGTAAGGAITLTDSNWSIEPGYSLSLEAKAKMPRWTQESAKASIATINWTIDWDSGSVTPPPVTGHTITIGTGEHGTVNDTSDLTTNAAGQIVTFPSTTPDTGYIFDHWEDEAGNVVDVDTVFDGPATINPVFVIDTTTPSPANWFTTNGTDTITGLSDEYLNMVDAPTVLVIPKAIGGTTITKIGANAFEGKNLITKVILPDTVTSIGMHAFKGCSSLDMEVGPGVQIWTMNGRWYVGGAFDGCKSLKLHEETNTNFAPLGATFEEVWLNSKLVEEDWYILNKLGIYQVFYDGAKVGTVHLSEGTSKIGTYAFRNLSAGELNIPKSVESIASNSFEKFEGTINIYKPEGSLQGAPWGATSATINWLG